jgi:3-hydroxyacyl-CoA dehydrogenase/enoyl-CoA hydratase/3-hydroxybutyryl-CoA epimerase
LGWGFPPHLGGPIGQIHTVGVAEFVKTFEALAQRVGPRFAPPQLLRDMAQRGATFYTR